MSEQPSKDPFEECKLSPDAILGTRTFEDVLFTDETETPVNVLTGEIPPHSQASVDGSRPFAVGINSDTPHIALPTSVGTPQSQRIEFMRALFPLWLEPAPSVSRRYRASRYLLNSNQQQLLDLSHDTSAIIQ
jgi:hypothetical protein